MIALRVAGAPDYKIRIGGIDAPEKRQAFGNRSKQNLAKLALNRQAQLDCYKTDRYRRKICRVFVDGRDVGLAQISAGLAWWYRQYSAERTVSERQDYERAEAEAKARGRGLWHDQNPVPIRGDPDRQKRKIPHLAVGDCGPT